MNQEAEVFGHSNYPLSFRMNLLSTESASCHTGLSELVSDPKAANFRIRDGMRLSGVLCHANVRVVIVAVVRSIEDRVSIAFEDSSQAGGVSVHLIWRDSLRVESAA